MSSFTEDQVAQLAPDASSLKAGRDLANERKWVSMNHNHRVLWGEVQGSGSQPYKTQVDLVSSGFKCSCPSRKFPCKHGLGLMFLYARRADLFNTTPTEPDWVAEWMESRDKRTVQQKEAPKHPDEKTTKSKKKTEAIRLELVNAGIEEASLLIRDLLRGGLIQIPNKGATFFEKAAARMVDQKAPGLARMLRAFNEINYANPSIWHEEVLEHATKIWMVLQAFKQLDKLPEPMQHDIRSLIGWSKLQAELLADADAEQLEDEWLVLARFATIEDKINIVRYYLWGTKTGRSALILDSFSRGVAASIVLMIGSIMQGVLVFYPSNRPFRALIKSKGKDDGSLPQKVVCYADFYAAHRSFASDITKYPWEHQVVQLIDHLLLVSEGNNWYFSDANEMLMPIDSEFSEKSRWDLLALSGGKACMVAVLRKRNALIPLGIWIDHKYKTV